MLVLGIGYAAGAEVTGVGRALETLIGAAVGVLVNVAFPPAVQTRNAGLAIERFADGIAVLLEEAAAGLAAGPVEVETTARWLDDARRLNRHAPQVDKALTQAEESRRLNVRALGTRKPGPSLREGLDNLEHASVSVRTLLRAVHDATREQTGIREDAAYAEEVRLTASALMGAVAAVVRSYGLLIRRGIEYRGPPESTDLHDALDALRTRRSEVAGLLLTDPRGRDVLWGLNAALLTTVDRVLLEIDTGARPV
jgi:hypothetical protein